MTRILVAEDSTTQAKALRQILEAEGFEASVAHDGAVALDFLKSAAFDLILTDILMPSVSGYELCRHVRKDPKLSQIPVVLLTALSDPADIVMGLECGADNYIIKPVDGPRLVNRLRHVLSTKRMRAESTPPAGVDIILKGKKFTVAADLQTALDFLVSAFEDFSAVQELQHEGRIEEARRSFQAEAYRTRENLFRKQKEQLEQLIGAAAHDLQEPLRAVVSYTELLQQRYHSKLDKDAQEFIGFAVRGAYRMKDLIGDLSILARVHAATGEITSTDCAAILTRVLAELGPAIRQSNAVVTYDSLPIVMADSSQLSKVFEELIDNGIKFRGDGPPRIHVSVQEKENEWLFAVQDNGMGVEKRDSARIFAIFKRLHSMEKYAGTGAGLAICARIIENHGGRIWVESEPGKGSTFFFTIPVNPSEAPQ